MGILTGLFDPPQTRKHRGAAMAAVKLRQQAARDVHIELQVLVPFFRAAAAWHQEAIAAGNMELAGRLADGLEAANELLERVGRAGPSFEAEVVTMRQSASTASDWERYASFELEVRAGFMTMREQIKGHTAALMLLNREASQGT